MPDSKRYTIFNAAAPRAITSSTDATPIVVTTTAAHGLSTGDVVNIIGHTTNVAANGTYRITKASATTFSLQNKDTAANIAGSGAGAGADGTFNVAANIPFCADFKTATFSINTDGGGDAAMTMKIVGSNGKSATDDTAPDFAQSKGPSNAYEYLMAVDLEDGSYIDGDVGFVVATADDNRSWEINVNKYRWVSAIITAGTHGEVTVVANLFDNQ